ncbi:hypothetical protein N7508_007466 [Penicillium antarcticum]|uniref:uncharacterized protein n=1 Tax=Penicillium antarcticum TaxID=416450 RepID=UPI0023A58573|nr:uncharacterized protein N7508_007466 [Penicillium antarcticum]KAJ5300223.1 hypothetical protein N7508_007466 [Penicillium antarcticum]
MTSIMGTDFETKARYCDLNIQNLGTLGVVCSAYDSITHHKVAIKKISKPFKSSVLARNTFREVFLLSKLRHTNVRVA